MTFIDLTIKITPRMVTDANGNEKKSLTGHLGTHFDVMNKEFPPDYLERNGIVFDVSHIRDRDINIPDIDIRKVEPDMFIAFYSGFIEEEGYGSKKYFSEHPQLSDGLIDALLLRHISIIGIDFAGVRRGSEHTPKDQYCADRGVFIVENLCNLKQILAGQTIAIFLANTYPINYSGMTGLPCRVVAKM
jgi:kynurenine formamidase